jgi:hypothetical protein
MSTTLDLGNASRHTFQCADEVNRKSFFFTSLSLHLLANTCNMRNPGCEKTGTHLPGTSGIDDKYELVDESWMMTLGRRIFGELCFAGIFVVALVETVVRALFMLPGYLISLCYEGETSKEIYETAVTIGPLFTLASAYGALTGLVHNIYAEVLMPLNPNTYHFSQKRIDGMCNVAPTLIPDCLFKCAK